MGIVNVWKAFRRGDGATLHIRMMLRYLFLEMFGLGLATPLFQAVRYAGKSAA